MKNIEYIATGDANCYSIRVNGSWLMAIRINGELTVERQKQIMDEMVDALNKTAASRSLVLN